MKAATVTTLAVAMFSGFLSHSEAVAAPTDIVSFPGMGWSEPPPDTVGWQPVNVAYESAKAHAIVYRSQKGAKGYVSGSSANDRYLNSVHVERGGNVGTIVIMGGRPDGD